MSLDTMILDASTRQAFYRGEDLVASGAVHTWEAAPVSDGVIEITGSVDEHGRRSDPVTLTLDLTSQQVISHSCPCSAAARDPHLCKHGVALGLAYLDARRTCGSDVTSSSEAAERAAQAPHADATLSLSQGDAPDPVIRLQAQTQELLERYRADHEQTHQSRPAPIQEAQTSPQIARIVYACAAGLSSEEEADLLLGEDTDTDELSPVELYPTLIAGSHTSDGGHLWGLRLRIGREHTLYHVRQIAQLVTAWDDHTTASYGKNLTFCHIPSAFSERAQALLDLIGRIWHTQEALRGSGTTTFTTASARTLALSDRDAAELLDIMIGSTIRFESGPDPSNSKARNLLVEIGDPDPALQIDVVHGQRGGYEVCISPDVNCVLSGSTMYLLTEKYAWRCSDAYRAAMAPFCRAALPALQPLHVRSADMPGFYAAVLPALRDHARLEMPDDLELLMPPAAHLTYKISLAHDLVSCDATVAYGTHTVGLFDPISVGGPLRDPIHEHAAIRLVHMLFPLRMAEPHRGGPSYPSQRCTLWDAPDAPGGRPCFEATDTEALYHLLTDGLEILAESGEVLLSDNLRNIVVRPAPRVRVEATVSGGLLDLTVDAGDLSPHDLLAYLASYERKQHYVRLAGGDIMCLEEGNVRAIAELAVGLGTSARSLVAGLEELPLNRAPFVDAMMKRAEGVQFDRDEGFRSVIRDFDSIGDSDFVEPASLRQVLRPYQREGFKWMSTLAKLGFGGILADDMGLGKTIQAIAFLLAHHECDHSLPSLIICPSSLIYNWVNEFARFAPQLDVVAIVGSAAERSALIDDAAAHDILITSYELLRRDIEHYGSQRFFCQFLDEAQYIKNHATQSARCAKRICAQVRFALTGTPIENRLSELWSIFDFLMPGMLAGREAFRRRFELPIAAGDEEAAQRLQCMVGPFVLRRMKTDVLKDLPDKNESVVHVRLEGEQEKLYRATADRLALALTHKLPHEFAADRIAILAELTRLRQICCDPHLVYEDYDGGSAKLDTCIELVQNAVDSSHKVLLFSQFTSMLEIIAARLTECDIAYHRLTGATPKEERAHLVSSFQTDDTPLFLISLKAGGVGLNLTAADIVIHYDPWWNLAAQNQATDRAHRIGQEQTVTVWRLIAKDTIEERIVDLQQSKRDLAESIVGGDAAGSARFTKEDILALLD